MTHTRLFNASALLVAITLVMLGLARAESQSSTFKNPIGQETGRADRQGNTTTFRNERGQEIGRAEYRPDGTVIYFNERGQRTRSSSGSSRERR